MSLYPSLEDMKVDHMVQAQVGAAAMQQNFNPQQQAAIGTLYPAIADFMGMELSADVIAMNMPEYSQIAASSALAPVDSRANMTHGMVAPLSGGSVALQKSFVTQGIRQLILCKDAEGRVGLRLKAINNGLFVCLVIKGSPAALGGLRFGDQILEINGQATAGMSDDQGHKLFKQAPVNGINLAVRDRPFERTLTLHKDSAGTVGFHFKNGKIVGLVKDSSAARNGLLIDHQLVEVNGQNVVGMKDKEITKVIENADRTITVTILPYSIYKHMIDKMATGLLKNSMDHTPAI